MLKRIEMLTDVKHDGGLYFKGETRFVSPELAGYFCGVGWAQDLGGQIQTGTPDTTEKTLVVDAGKHGHAAQNP